MGVGYRRTKGPKEAEDELEISVLGGKGYSCATDGEDVWQGEKDN